VSSAIGYGNGISSLFNVGSGTDATLVTFSISSEGTVLTYADSTTITLKGGIGFNTSGMTSVFSNSAAGLSGTANFGIASTVPTFS